MSLVQVPLKARPSAFRGRSTCELKSHSDDNGSNAAPQLWLLWATPLSPASCVSGRRAWGSLAQLLRVIAVIYLGTELEQGSSCFLLELIFCPTFISYCTFLWGQSSFV